MSQDSKKVPSYTFDPKDSLVPITKSGFYDADLLNDMMVLSRIPLRVQNIPVIQNLVRLIKGKIVHRIKSLQVISKASGYPLAKGLIDKLYELKASFDNQEKAINNYAKGLLARQAMMHKMVLLATKRRMTEMFTKTKDRYEGLRRHLASRENLRKYFIARIIQKKFADSQLQQQPQQQQLQQQQQGM